MEATALEIVAVPWLDDLRVGFVRADYPEIVRSSINAPSLNPSKEIVGRLAYAQTLITVVSGPPAFKPLIGEQLRKVAQKL